MFAQSSDPGSLKGFRKSQCSWPCLCFSLTVPSRLPALFSQSFDPLNFWNMLSSLRAIPETVFIKEITMISRHGTSYFPSGTRSNTQPPAFGQASTFSFRLPVWTKRLSKDRTHNPTLCAPLCAPSCSVGCPCPETALLAFAQGTSGKAVCQDSIWKGSVDVTFIPSSNQIILRVVDKSPLQGWPP